MMASIDINFNTGTNPAKENLRSGATEQKPSCKINAGNGGPTTKAGTAALPGVIYRREQYFKAFLKSQDDDWTDKACNVFRGGALIGILI
jgi:hypothetical protein